MPRRGPQPNCYIIVYGNTTEFDPPAYKELLSKLGHEKNVQE